MAGEAMLVVLGQGKGGGAYAYGRKQQRYQEHSKHAGRTAVPWHQAIQAKQGHHIPACHSIPARQAAQRICPSTRKMLRLSMLLEGMCESDDLRSLPNMHA